MQNSACQEASAIDARRRSRVLPARQSHAFPGPELEPKLIKVQMFGFGGRSRNLMLNPRLTGYVFVDELDLADLRFDGVDPEVTGRPSYHPSVLLKS